MANATTFQNLYGADDSIAWSNSLPTLSYNYGNFITAAKTPTSTIYPNGWNHDQAHYINPSPDGWLFNYPMTYDIYAGNGTSTENTIYLNDHSLNWPYDLTFTNRVINGQTGTYGPQVYPYQRNDYNETWQLVTVNVTTITHLGQGIVIWYGNSTISDMSTNVPTTKTAHPPRDSQHWSIEDKNIVAFGASSTYGTVAYNSQDFMAENYPEYAILNSGVPGQGLKAMINRFDATVAGYNPEYVINWFGNNDVSGGASPDTVNAYIKDIYDMELSINAIPVVMTSHPRDDFTAQEKINATIVNDYMTTQAMEKKWPYLDEYAIVTDPETGRMYDQYNSGDGIHLRQIGYQVVGSNISLDTQVVPTAGFNVSATTLTMGDTVSFTDQSTGTVRSWQWNFGDGSVNSSKQNPEYRYKSNGTFIVILTATNPAGSTSTAKTITVTDNTISMMNNTTFFLQVIGIVIIILIVLIMFAAWRFGIIGLWPMILITLIGILSVIMITMILA